MAWYRWLFTLSFLGLVHRSLSQVPCTLGNPAVDITPRETTQAADQHFLVSGNAATCFAAISRWDFFATAECHDMLFQVWRPIGGNNYDLVGGNQYICDNPTDNTAWQHTPLAIEQIPMQPGDVYGWFTTAGTALRMMPHDSAPSGSFEYFATKILQTPCGQATGTTCDWSTGQTEIRKYSLQPVLVARPQPYFTNLPAPTTVQENSPAGTHVFNVKGYNSFNYNDVLDPVLTYSISATTCGADVFVIDSVTGSIELTGAPLLDFETSGAVCQLTIQVVEDPTVTTPTVEILTINVQDVNEPHWIISPPAAESIDSKNNGIGFLVHRILTGDVEPAGTTTKACAIVSSDPPNAPVVINTDTNPTNPNRVDVNQNLQYWAGPTSFVIGIICQDGYHTAGPEDLTITITNLREAPIIMNLEHTITIPENSVDAIRVWHTVEAEEIPDGNNDRGDLVYIINAIYPLDSGQGLFIIDPDDGEVRHKANPGFEYYDVNKYDVEIYVVYTGASPPDFESDKKNLTVNIDHVNEPPYHEPWAQTFTSSIQEKESMGTTLPGVKLDSYDRDYPAGDWVHYTISGTGSHLFAADNETGLVYVIAEAILTPGVTDETYNLDVYVIDSYGAKDNASLTVTVWDINDHSPVFVGDPYTGSIEEDAVGGTGTTAFVSATDDDGGLNADLRFSILEPTPSLYFQVDPITFEVTNKQPIPYEIYQNMTFTVVVYDQGEPVLNDTATVFIEILDTNTIEPVFDPDFYSLDLRSDTPVGDVIFTAVAEDIDGDQVQDLTYYSLILDDYFFLDKPSGEISVSRDLVAFRKHLLYVGAQDDASSRDNHHSNPLTVRVDTYNPKTTLVDIYLNIPIEAFLPTQATFLATLNAATPDWDMRIESVRLEGDDTVVRVYGVESALPDLKGNEAMDKVFIDEDEIIKLLREKLKGTPSDVLTGPDFAAWEPVAVHPAYPIWIIDTPGGVAFLSIMLILIVAGLITLFVLLAKKYRWCCYKNAKPRKSKNPKRKVKPAATGDKDQFKLNYQAGDDPYVIANNKSIGNTYDGYHGPLIPMSTYNAPPPKVPPKVPKTKSPDIFKKNTMRTSLNEKDPDHYLPPVQVPEDDWRPFPRQRGGEAA